MHASSGFVRVPVITTKLAPPELPAVLVDRPGPLAALRRQADVTVVVAPAGYGKSVAVRQWVATSSLPPVAWFSLDPLDRNPLSFWRHLIAALDAAIGLGPEPELVLGDRGVDDLAFLQTLVHRLLELDRPVVLVLDDLHHLTDRAAVDQLALLVERAGRVLRLVVTSRTNPALPMARWRLDGRAVEVTEADLRLDTDAAAALLEGYGCAPLSPADLAEVVRRSEGWAAGLQLAALARPDHVADVLKEVPARDGLISTYLVDEVLERLTPRQRQVAETLSVLEEFDLELAESLTERADVGEVLGELHDGRVFLVRTSGHSTYRFHHLFRDVLREELRSRDGGRWAALHRSASALLADRGQVDAAFGHLMALGDLDAATDLVLRPALELSDRGWGNQFRRWLEQLPSDYGVHKPDLMLDLAFANFSAGRLDVAQSWLDRAGAILPPDDARVYSRRMMIALANADIDTCERLLAQPVSDQAAPGSFESRLDRLVARAHLLRGAARDAEAALDRAATKNPGDVVRDVTDRALRSRVLTLDGSPRAALDVAGEARRRAAALGLQNNPAVLEAHIGWAAAALAAADVDEATVAVEALLDVVDVVDYPYSRAHALSLLMQLHGARHGWATVSGAFGDLAAQCRWNSADPGGFIVAPPLVRGALAVGDVEQARRAVSTMPAGLDRTLSEAALLVADRRRVDALDLLEPRDAWPMAARVEGMVLAALASPDVTAQQLVDEALALASPLRLAAPFVDRGARLTTLVGAAPLEAKRFLPASVAPATRTNDRVRALVEPLTPRELELLAMLPTHLSNAAMGERLFISVNTVKTNLKAIYRKMGTGSRAETVELAQRMGLIPAPTTAS